MPDVLTQAIDRLASGRDNLRQVALLDAPPPSGFKGTADPAADGGATFLVDQPERVVVRAHATAPGFLHLADQYATGWYATVNGAPTPVLRANHVFRAVEVPAGESLVELRYAPASLWLGAAITGATLVAILGAAIVSRQRHAGAW